MLDEGWAVGNRTHSPATFLRGARFPVQWHPLLSILQSPSAPLTSEQFQWWKGHLHAFSLFVCLPYVLKWPRETEPSRFTVQKLPVTFVGWESPQSAHRETDSVLQVWVQRPQKAECGVFRVSLCVPSCFELSTGGVMMQAHPGGDLHSSVHQWKCSLETPSQPHSATNSVRHLAALQLRQADTEWIVCHFSGRHLCRLPIFVLSLPKSKRALKQSLCPF